ncbi:MAG: hypothetical protein RLZZ393_1461 [Pseudomonadota bacterium]
MRQPVSAGLRAAGTADVVHGDSLLRHAPTAQAAFIGPACKGPVDEPVLVTDPDGFADVFGPPCPGASLSPAVAQFFAQGGESALVVRVASDARAPTIDVPAGREWLHLCGRAPGTGEHLRAAIDFDGIAPEERDRFNLTVQRVRRRGSERVEAQEIHRRLSVDPDAERPIAKVLSASRLVRLVGTAPRERPAPTRGVAGVRPIGYVQDNADGDDGRPLDDYDLIGNEGSRRGLFALAGQSFAFLCIPPLAAGRDIGPGLLLAAAAFCRRHHALLLVDPPQAWRGASDALRGLRDWHFRSPDAVMCFPRFETTDGRDAEAVAGISSGVLAGLLARADRAGDPWWMGSMVAGTRPRAGVRPSARLTPAEATLLAAQGLGIVGTTEALAGLRSLQALGRRTGEPAGFAARRLLSWIARSIEQGTRWVTRERDEPDLGARARRQVLGFLQDLARQGAFTALELPTEPFVVDETGLPPATPGAGFRLLYGLGAPGSGTALGWMLEQDGAGATTRPVAVNAYALRSRA